ncbi:MAG: hypothetical protein E7588_00985 [Ruminococcaceae bacterium]|nr:hypothetical protein [Oscillospiraceae bacterium]
MGKVLKTIIKIVFISIVVLLNVLIWGRIFISCDAPITNKIILDEQILEDFKKNPLSYNVYEYFPPITMDELGKVQTRYVTHIRETDDFQFTIKYNIGYFENNVPLDFKLRCVSGEEERVIEDIYSVTQDRYIFRYLRFSAQNINFTQDDSLFLDVFTADGQLFTTLTLVAPDISSMYHKTVSLKTMLKKQSD